MGSSCCAPLKRGPPFEPLPSCSLQDLTQKVLFLVSLATARRVGELQAVSREVSFSGADIYLSYLLEFRAKTESSVNSLPRSFCVRSLEDFVSDLPEELLLCPVRALRLYLSRTASISPRPRALFVSPCSPSWVLSKNALSFFLRDLIACASSSSAGSSSSSAFRAHSVRGVVTSWAFSRNASFSSILAAATWSFSYVFTYFYLKDVQFSSSSGFSLEPLVAAGCVVLFCCTFPGFVVGVRFPSLAAGSESIWGGGGVATHSSPSLHRSSSVVWLLMTCVLVRQIPYRVMSLGLKVLILR